MRFYIETYGCQMNEYDSQLAEYELLRSGHEKCTSPEEADLVIFNTCTVRKSAEDRVYGQLGHMKRHKKERNILVGVIGCMAQKSGQSLIDEVPHVDFVLGTDHLDDILRVVRFLEENPGQKVVRVEQDDAFLETEELPRKEAQLSEFISIMRGCNNFCTYCIVPYVRGRERSRDPGHIIEEITRLVQGGTREITLLGQNVNSYQWGKYDFLGLMTAVHDISGLDRIRFTTSHPKDMTPGILKDLMTMPKVCNHYHLPLQSGSDAILKAMNRKYTAAHYRSLVESIRKADPLASITTDIIVGFSGETDEDYLKTREMAQFAEYDSAFIFKYNPRPGTKGWEIADDVPGRKKQRRLEDLNALVKETSDKRNALLLGEKVEILVDGRGRSSDIQQKGRTGSNKVVVFDSEEDLFGRLITVEITDAAGWTLFGKI